MSKKLDTSNLPSHRGNKRPRVDSSMPSKTPVIILNPAALPAFVQRPMVPKVDAPIPRPNAELSSSSPKALPPETVSRFKQVVRNKDVSICYDMSVKEFEYSTIHNLFKVTCLCP